MTRTNFWHVIAFIFSYSWPQKLVWYIFHMDMQCILGAMYAKSIQNVTSDRVHPAGSLPLHFWVIYNVFWPL
jgi:hypothetical protein